MRLMWGTLVLAIGAAHGDGVTDGIIRIRLELHTAPGDGAPGVPGDLGLSNAFAVTTR